MYRGKPAATVKLSLRQKRLLENYRNKRTAPLQSRIRIDIVLGASEKLSNSDLSKQLGISRKTVILWRGRWVEGYEKLCDFEQGLEGTGVKDHELLQKMLSLLGDTARSGSPNRISLAQKKQIVALACRKPEEFDIPMTQWNREMLARVAIAQGIVESISPRYISEILKKREAPTA